MTSLVDALRAATFYDVSPPIDDRLPVFPGHPSVEIDAASRTHERDGYFLQTISFGEHIGAHVDAPAHAVAGLADRTIDRYSVDRFVLPYVKYDLTAYDLEPGDLVTAGMLEEVERRDGLVLRGGEIAIVQFGWDRYLRPASEAVEEREWWIRNAPGLAADACERLVDHGVRAVGSDTATCDAAIVDGEITSAIGHLESFLPREILLFEGLVGLGEAPLQGLFIGLPLRIAGGSGSPIRAVLVA